MFWKTPREFQGRYREAKPGCSMPCAGPEHRGGGRGVSRLGCLGSYSAPFCPFRYSRDLFRVMGFQQVVCQSLRIDKKSLPRPGICHFWHTGDRVRQSTSGREIDGCAIARMYPDDVMACSGLKVYIRGI
ncbi:hypothetical protein B0T16DRAFT_216157 [Cercophora newfieldiana]|uniref:Uncharacterized protein n=1 Tax=Cercophora newfieldiana TaxID=92897 RepID=A0AA39XWF8_9PEZI|nr:hypothetical protein B0T16DRAFT_216157 [Cercophora newfieldiana]